MIGMVHMWERLYLFINDYIGNQSTSWFLDHSSWFVFPSIFLLRPHMWSFNRSPGASDITSTDFILSIIISRDVGSSWGLTWNAITAPGFTYLSRVFSGVFLLRLTTITLPTTSNPISMKPALYACPGFLLMCRQSYDLCATHCCSCHLWRRFLVGDLYMLILLM